MSDNTLKMIREMIQALDEAASVLESELAKGNLSKKAEAHIKRGRQHLDTARKAALDG